MPKDFCCLLCQLTAYFAYRTGSKKWNRGSQVQLGNAKKRQSISNKPPPRYQALYPNPQGNFFCFVFDEEVQLSPLVDVAKIISLARLDRDHEYIDGTPIILIGSELQQYILSS